MKKIINILVAIGLIALSSCKKEVDNNNIQNNSNNYSSVDTIKFDVYGGSSLNRQVNFYTDGVIINQNNQEYQEEITVILNSGEWIKIDVNFGQMYSSGNGSPYYPWMGVDIYKNGNFINQYAEAQTSWTYTYTN